MKKKMQIISAVLCVVLCLAAVPTTAFAEGYIDNSTTVNDTLDNENQKYLNENSAYSLYGDYIVGVECNTECSVFKANFKQAVTVKSNGAAVEENGIIKAGDTVEISELGTRTVVISGDMNSDGVLSVTDVVLLRAGIINNSFTAMQKATADVDINGTPSVTDITKLLTKIIK